MFRFGHCEIKLSMKHAGVIADTWRHRLGAQEEFKASSVDVGYSKAYKSNERNYGYKGILRNKTVVKRKLKPHYNTLTIE